MCKGEAGQAVVLYRSFVFIFKTYGFVQMLEFYPETLSGSHCQKYYSFLQILERQKKLPRKKSEEKTGNSGEASGVSED